MNQRWIWALAGVLSLFMGSFSPLCGSDIRETENDKAALKKDFFGQEEDFDHKKRLAFHHMFESLWHLAKNKGQENEGTKHHVQEVEKLNVKGRQKEFKETKDLIEKSLTASYRTHHLLGRLTPNVEHHNDQDWKKEILSHARIAEEGFCQLFGFLPPLKEEGLLDELLRTSYEKEAFKDFTPCVFPRHLGNGFNIILTRDDKENTATFKVFSWQKAATEQSVLLLEKTLSQFPQALDFQDSEIPLVFKGLVDEQRRLVIQRLFSPSSVRLNAPEMRLGHRKDVEGVQGAVEPTFSPDQDDLTLLDFGLLSIGEELEVSGEIFDLVWGQAHISKNLRMTMSKMIRLGRYVQFPQSFQETFESYPVSFSYLYQLPLGMTEKEKEAGSAEAYFEQVKKEDRTEMKLHVKGSAVLDAPLLQNDYADLQIEKELYSYIKRYENKGRILLKSQGYFFGDPYIRSHQAFETLISYSAAREVRFQDRTMEVSYPMPVGPHPVWWIEGYMQFMDPNVVVFEYCGDFHKFAEDAFCGVETIDEKTVAPSAEELQSLRAAGSSQRKVILVDRREAYSTIGHGLHIKFNEQRYAESMRQASERSGGHGLASLNATWGAQSALHNFHYGRFGAAGSEQALQKLQTYFQDPGLSSTFSSAAKSFYQSHPHLLSGNTTTSSSMPSFASNLQNRINTLRKEDLQQAKTTYKTFKEPELLASYKTKPQTKERFVEAKDGDYASLMRRTPRKKSSSSAYDLPNPLLDQALEGSRWYRRGTAREEKPESSSGHHRPSFAQRFFEDPCNSHPYAREACDKIKAGATWLTTPIPGFEHQPIDQALFWDHQVNEKLKNDPRWYVKAAGFLRENSDEAFQIKRLPETPLEYLNVAAGVWGGRKAYTGKGGPSFKTSKAFGKPSNDNTPGAANSNQLPRPQASAVGQTTTTTTTSGGSAAAGFQMKAGPNTRATGAGSFQTGHASSTTSSSTPRTSAEALDLAGKGKSNINLYDDATPASVFFGSRNLGFMPNLLTKNKPGVIQGRKYSGHAFDQMQSRGILPSAVENTIKYGEILPGKFEGTMRYYDPLNNISIVLKTKDQKVITVSFGDIKQ